MSRLRPLLLLPPLALACSGGRSGASASEGAGSSSSSTTTATGSTGAQSSTGLTGDGSGTQSGSGTTSTGDATTDALASTSSTSSSGTDPFKFDVGHDTAGADLPPPAPKCKVEGDDDPGGSCRIKAPAESFNPAIQWEWWGPDGEVQSSVIPLVANFTDDNGDGDIDLCDIPDVLVVATSGFKKAPGHIYLLDGATGALHYKIPEAVKASVTPAIGDIDGDGLVEIVTMDPDGLVAFEHDGALKWKAPTPTNSDFMAVALADLDADGDVEIVVGNFVADHNGTVLWTAADFFWPGPDPIYLSATAVADLDGDGRQEVVLGRSAYHHDGKQYFKETGIGPGYPQIADLDGDGFPEVLITNKDGLSVLEHDGEIKYANLRPTGDPPGQVWMRPATIHDFDGDGVVGFAMASGPHYSVFEADAGVVWTADVAEPTCCAAGTAFDFLGDGVAEAMFADEQNMFIFDSTGVPLLTAPRSSWTNIEYPVVVDVDNDGSAEILVVSNSHDGVTPQTAPTLRVIRDVEDRWIQARRIWNQHTYHVTNVREDGTIPQFEKPSWKHLNTYRTNAQIEGGAVCKPDPPG
ncbi:MAG TPA: VCBS repeat-containing protein [Nannocystis sp.]